MNVRTRFAPSPTGFLHIGGARTALFSWLYAKKYNGQFLLRIEDTDRERSTPEAIDAIFDGMNWLGLKPDETVEYQTRRFGRYSEVLNVLLAEGKAYRCNCSKERLERLREQQMQNKEKPRYDGCCRNKNIADDEDNCVIRFKNPETGSVIVHDQVYGDVVFQNSELDDLIISRSDGAPTYNFCVVVDDWDMKITHVIRGDDHLNNTPRQMNILQALGASIPVYAHLPMILGETGKKLSKRDGAVGVTYYRELGILPEAMRNYLVRLGWSYGNQEIFSESELLQLFDINAINKSAAALNHEKLFWLNQQYLKSLPTEQIEKALQWYWQFEQIDTSNGPTVNDIIEIQKDRVKTLKELVDKSRYFYQEIEAYDPKAAEQFMTYESISLLKAVQAVLLALSVWTKDSLHLAIQSLLKERNLKMPQLAQPLRCALTGNILSPSIDVTLCLIGKERSIIRIQKAIQFIEEQGVAMEQHSN